MKKVFHPAIVGSLLSVLPFSSCITPGFVDPVVVPLDRQKENYYKIPVSPNVPLLREKADFTFSSRISFGKGYTGAQVQTAYLPSHHFGIMGAYGFGRNKMDNLQHYTVELGAGYVQPVNALFHMECYAGLGNQMIRNFHYTGTSKINATYFFIQPAIGVINHGKTVRAGLVSKFQLNNFHTRHDYFDYAREPFTASQFELMRSKPRQLSWEPGVVFRFGFKQFLFHSGFSYNINLTTRDLNSRKENFSLGGSLVIGKFSSKS